MSATSHLLASSNCQTESRPGARGLRRPGILIADDDLVIRSLLNFAFKANGFAVWLAEDGLEALRIYRPRTEEIDYVLLDVQMPVMDGFEALQQLQEINPHVYCCLMSGSLDDDQVRELFLLGAFQVFHKPIRPGTLVRYFQDLALSSFQVSSPTYGP